MWFLEPFHLCHRVDYYYLNVTGTILCIGRFNQTQVSLLMFSCLFRNLKIGYFSQHHVDQLDLNVCSVELLLNRFPGNYNSISRHHTESSW